MEKLDCDVLVVGAGPAGLSAARAAAIKGLKVICIDKKKILGEPVKCAEGIGSYLFDYLPFSIPNKFIDFKIKGIILNSNGISIKKTGEFWSGFSLDRANFEKWLGKNAEDNGVLLKLETDLKAIYYNSRKVVKKAIFFNKKKRIEIYPKFVIAADGVHSKMLTLLDVYEPKYGKYAKVYSWEMNNLNLKFNKYEQIFFDDFTPKGYAYIFPKSDSVANIGVGGVYPTKNMSLYFKDFLKSDLVKNQVKNGVYISNKSKDAPFDNFLSNRYFGNVIAVGDAANDNLKPFVEGILPGIIIGDAVGKSITEKKFINPLKELFLESDKLLSTIYKLYSLDNSTKSNLLMCYLISGLISSNQISNLYKMPISELIKLA